MRGRKAFGCLVASLVVWLFAGALAEAAQALLGRATGVPGGLEGLHIGKSIIFWVWLCCAQGVKVLATKSPAAVVMIDVPLEQQVHLAEHLT